MKRLPFLMLAWYLPFHFGPITVSASRSRDLVGAICSKTLVLGLASHQARYGPTIPRYILDKKEINRKTSSKLASGDKHLSEQHYVHRR